MSLSYSVCEHLHKKSLWYIQVILYQWDTFCIIIYTQLNELITYELNKYVAMNYVHFLEFIFICHIIHHSNENKQENSAPIFNHQSEIARPSYKSVFFFLFQWKFWFCSIWFLNLLFPQELGPWSFYLPQSSYNVIDQKSTAIFKEWFWFSWLETLMNLWTRIIFLLFQPSGFIKDLKGLKSSTCSSCFPLQKNTHWVILFCF